MHEVQPEKWLHGANICSRCMRIPSHIKTRDQTICISTLVGGFNPSEKYESQLGGLFPIYGKIKDVPNRQPGHQFSDEITGMMVNHTSAPLNSRLKWPVWLLRQSNHCWSIMNTISTNKQAIPKTEYHTSVVWPTWSYEYQLISTKPLKILNR